MVFLQDPAPRLQVWFFRFQGRMDNCLYAEWVMASSDVYYGRCAEFPRARKLDCYVLMLSVLLLWAETAGRVDGRSSGDGYRSAVEYSAHLRCLCLPVGKVVLILKDTQGVNQR